VFLAGRFEAKGEVSLSGAKIGGQLTCRDGKFQNPNGTALNAQSIETSGSMHLNEGFEAKGTVWLPGAKIGGQLTCRDGKFQNPNGTALNAQSIETSENVILSGEFTAEGTVLLAGARIGGRLSCSDGTFRNPDSTALNAQNIETGADVVLAGGFAAEGEVWLSGAKIGGQLVCLDGTFQNPGGTALNAQNIETSKSVFLSGEFAAEGTVRLSGAKIGGELNLRGGVFKDKLVLEHVVARKLMDDKECWPKAGMLFLDGFQYEEIAYGSPVGWKDRQKWLERQEEFVPGPYEQLAKVYRARGDAHAARKVLIAKHKRQIRSVKRSPVQLGPLRISGVWRRRLSPVLFFQRLFGMLVGYGHAPWRAAWFLAGLVLFAWGTFIFAVDENRMVPVEEPHDAAAFADATKGKGVRADECAYEVEYPCFHEFWYAVDVTVPLVDLRQQSYWAPTGGYRWAMWLVIVLGWLLVSAVAVGLTLLFRGPGM